MKVSTCACISKEEGTYKYLEIWFPEKEKINGVDSLLSAVDVLFSKFCQGIPHEHLE